MLAAMRHGAVMPPAFTKLRYVKRDRTRMDDLTCRKADVAPYYKVTCHYVISWQCHTCLTNINVQRGHLYLKLDSDQWEIRARKRLDDRRKQS